VFVVVSCALVAAIPSWYPDWYQDDQLPSAFRLLHTDRAHHAGIWFPRMAAELGFGYGQLLHQVYPPLGFELAAWIHALGFGYLDSLRVFFSLCLLSDALGMFVYARVLGLPRPTATLAAIAFVWAPYVLLDAHQGGDFGESIGIALLPWALAAFHRLAERTTPGRLATAALALGAVNLAHNITALFFTGLLVLYIALLAAIRRDPRAAFTAIGAIALGTALAAIYWMPALLELSYSHIGDQRVGSFNLARYLLDPTELIQPTLRAHYDGDAEHQYGLVALILTLAGIARLVLPRWTLDRGPWTTRAILLAFAAAFAVILAIQLRWAQVIWETVPLISFVQFPRRLFLFASLAGAPLIGLLAIAVPRIPPWPLVMVVGAAIGLSSLPGVLWPSSVSPAHRIFENQIGIGTLADRRFSDRSAYDDFFPRWVSEPAAEVPRVPSTNRAELYREANTLPVPRVRVVERGLLHLVLSTESTEPSALVLHAFYFPGWWASADDQPLIVDPVGPLGLIRIQIPPGTRTVRAALGDTPLRVAATAATLVAGLVLLALWVLATNRVRARMSVLAIVAVVFTPWLVHLRDARPLIPPVTHVEAQVAPFARIIGIEVSDARVPAGQSLNVTTLWLATDAPPLDAQTGVRLQHTESGRVVFERWGRPNRERTPTGKWMLGEIVPDPENVAVPGNAAPGRYRLLAGVRERGQVQAAPVAEIEIVVAR
jgi:hypothetical protein